MASSCAGSQPRIWTGALGAAALVLGAGPALANGAGVEANSNAAAVSSGQAVTSYLTPVASWDDEAGGDEHDDRLGRSVAGAVAESASLARRRPGVLASKPAARAAPAASRRPVAFAARLPVASRAVTSGFGLRRHPLLGDLRVHAGVDLAAPAGAPVVATADGTVSVADWAGGYGLLVAVEHGGGRQTRYAHLSRLNVAAGQRVRQGEVIGFVGSTGRSTGPHLHYETRINGRAVDPHR